MFPESGNCLLISFSRTHRPKKCLNFCISKHIRGWVSTVGLFDETHKHTNKKSAIANMLQLNLLLKCTESISKLSQLTNLLFHCVLVLDVFKFEMNPIGLISAAIYCRFRSWRLRKYGWEILIKLNFDRRFFIGNEYEHKSIILGFEDSIGEV